MEFTSRCFGYIYVAISTSESISCFKHHCENFCLYSNYPFVAVHLFFFCSQGFSYCYWVYTAKRGGVAAVAMETMV